jgi:ABC-type branched-subunit amino acid transport system ATPase component
MLELDDVHTFHGTSQVLFGLSMTVGTGEVVTLLGRNGMGKTTTVRSIMGLTPPRAGTIRFDGAVISGLPTFRVAPQRRHPIGDAGVDRRLRPDDAAGPAGTVDDHQSVGGGACHLSVLQEGC